MLKTLYFLEAICTIVLLKIYFISSNIKFLYNLKILVNIIYEKLYLYGYFIYWGRG